MTFNAIRENKILAKISEYTVNISCSFKLILENILSIILKLSLDQNHKWQKVFGLTVSSAVVTIIYKKKS